MAELSYAQVSALLKYDSETGKLYWLERPVEMFADGGHLAQHNCDKWNAKHCGKEAFYSRDGRGYLHGAIFGKIYSTHRVIWLFEKGEWPKLNIDHINGDKTDNRIENLRDVSTAENAKNTRRSSLNKSGVSGVSWYKASGMWRARIRDCGKEIHLGHFTDKESAVAARKKAEKDRGYHPNHGRD